MRTRHFILQAMGVALISTAAVNAQAEERFYDPSNAASPTGKTIGYELFKTIGCPGQQLFGTPCKDPAPKDTDGDGVTDDKDKCPTVYAKTADGCPLAAAPAPKKLVLQGVNFDNDKATLLPEAEATLNEAAASLKEWGTVKVEVAGHTDSVASNAYNQELSQRRANAVRNYLISKGIDANRLTAKGYGETMPIADNETEKGRYMNRRVELVPQK
jgi:outer membrane protein OmpA-like peptidoglycan-associated protein